MLGLLKKIGVCVVLGLLSVFICCESRPTIKKAAKDYTSWKTYLGGPERNHYSTLTQITPQNVSELKIAWTYKAPDSGQMQMNPIIVDTLLYGVTAALRVVALHAKTGKEVWRFGDSLKIWHSTSRGVSYWNNGNDRRVFYTRGSWLYALNALTGKPIQTFGSNGKIDLRSGLPETAKNKFVISNTPGTIYENLIIMPLRVAEDPSAAPGDIMAFNVISGNLEWVFHTIPHPDEPGYDTWENIDAYKNISVGAANNWAGMSLDEDSGIIYIPTGSAAPDFYGGHRKGSNLYANSLLALEASSGKLLWYFQFTHHDLWDRDAPAPPNLITITRGNKKVAAVAQVTKQGYVFLFDRETGKPLFSIQEKRVPTTTLEGETSWPTQPFPVKPKPFARASNDLTENDLSPYATNKSEILALFRKADKRLYAPPSTNPVLLFPGYDGAAEWGGAAADPDEGILYVNANEMAWIMEMKKVALDTTSFTLGERLYKKHCASCHQADLSGLVASGFPSLKNLSSKLPVIAAEQIITNGKGMMVGFPQLKQEEKDALLRFLYNEDEESPLKKEMTDTLYKLPYQHTGYHKFLDSNGLPAIAPPWGTLHAIDLNTGGYLWSIPFGETPSLKEKGFPQTGSENYGGAVVTKNGLLFIGATKDGFFRAFDKKTGTLLWEFKLPAAAFATPATYSIDGKQFVVIACGGEKLGTPKGNQIIAFALP